MEAGWKEHAAALEASALRFSPLLVTFLVVGCYLGITAATTDHETLLRGRSLTLPLVDAGVSIEGFFLVAPFLLLLLHAGVLAHLVLVMRRARAVLGQVPVGGLALSLSPAGELILRRHRPALLRGLISFLFYVTCCLYPLAVLCLLKGQFVAYHSEPIAGAQTAAIVVDLFIILFSVPRILGGVDGGWWWWRSPLDGPWEHLLRPLGFLLLLLALPFSLEIAVVPEGCEPPPRRQHLRRRWPPLSLVVRGRGTAPADDGGRQDGRPAILTDRDLRCADLRGISLAAADLGGSDLSGALLNGADLRRAVLSPRPMGGSGSRSASGPAKLEGASLVGAQLAGANLIGVSLKGAKLGRATLSGSALDGAVLERADMTSAVARNVSLVDARLDHAILDGADLSGADLSAVRAPGARAIRGRAICADFRGAQLAGASFFDAHLDGAVFSGADVRAVDFRHSSLRSTLGLAPDGNDLRRTSLAGSCLGRRSAQENPMFWPPRERSSQRSDFRHTILGALSAADLVAMRRAARAVEPTRRRAGCLARIRGDWSEEVCMQDPTAGPTNLRTGASPEEAAAYYADLRRSLALSLCEDRALGRALLRRVVRPDEVTSREVGEITAQALLEQRHRCRWLQRELQAEEIVTLQDAAGCWRREAAYRTGPDPLEGLCD